MTLRARLVLLAGAAVAIAICAAAAGSYLVVRSQLRGQIDESLEAPAERIAGGTFEHFLPARVLERLDEDAPPPPLLGEAEPSPQLLTPDGQVAGFPGPGGPRLPVGPIDRAIAANGRGKAFRDAEVEEKHLRILTVGLQQGGALMIPRSLEGVDEVLADTRIALGVLALSGIALAAGLAWLVAGRVIAPIAQLTDAAEHVSETRDLSRRIDVAGEDEVGRLANRFNVMLETLEASQAALAQSVSAQRQLVADASHELRTPVTSLRTDIELLLENPELSAEERARVLAETDERIEELTALINDVIELARGDELHERVEDVRLDEIVADSIRRLQRHSPERVVHAELEPTVIEGRPDRLGRAVNNLLDNADKYSPSAEPIEVAVSDGVVTVRDRGPGIAPEELEHVFDRFWRGAASRRQPGTGLGLAIVRQVAESHGGEASVENLAEGGAAFRLRLPIS